MYLLGQFLAVRLQEINCYFTFCLPYLSIPLPTANFPSFSDSISLNLDDSFEVQQRFSLLSSSAPASSSFRKSFLFLIPCLNLYQATLYSILCVHLGSIELSVPFSAHSISYATALHSGKICTLEGLSSLFHQHSPLGHYPALKEEIIVLSHLPCSALSHWCDTHRQPVRAFKEDLTVGWSSFRLLRI